MHGFYYIPGLEVRAKRKGEGWDKWEPCFSVPASRKAYVALTAEGIGGHPKKITFEWDYLKAQYRLKKEGA